MSIHALAITAPLALLAGSLQLPGPHEPHDSQWPSGLTASIQGAVDPMPGRRVLAQDRPVLNGRIPAGQGRVEWRAAVPTGVPGNARLTWTAQAPAAKAWIGVTLSGENDLTISGIEDGSPAQEYGLMPGDRLLSAGERELGGYQDLADAIGARRPGQTIRLGIERALLVSLSDEHRADDGRPLLGVFLDDNRVTGVQGGHPAEAAGLRQGDRLLTIGEHGTDSYDAIVGALRSLEGDTVDISILRTVKLELGSRPGEGEVAESWPESVRELTPDEWRVAPQEPREPRRPNRTPQLRERRELSAPLNTPRDPFMEPGQQDDSAGLRDELRALADEIATLRDEIAGLREQLRGMHADER